VVDLRSGIRGTLCCELVFPVRRFCVRLNEAVHCIAAMFSPERLVVWSQVRPSPPHPVERIGEGAVSVPTHFWKVVARKHGETLRVTCFLLANHSSEEELKTFVVPLHTVEQAIGWRLLPRAHSVTEDPVDAWKLK